jgi:hypothetical protein
MRISSIRYGVFALVLSFFTFASTQSQFVFGTCKARVMALSQ